MSLSIRQALKSRPGLFLCYSVLATFSCGSRTRPEKWIIPEGYAGWLRLDYAIKGAPLLPMEGGAYVVRMSQSGRIETSSPYNSSIDENEFFLATTRGFQRLGFSQGRMAHSQPAIDGYAVQSAFGFFKLASGSIQAPGKCVFVGSRRAFRDSGGDCQLWEYGQPEPPKFERQLLPGTADGANN